MNYVEMISGKNGTISHLFSPLKIFENVRKSLIGSKILFLSMSVIISGQCHIDPESLIPKVKWSQKVKMSVNYPS